MTPFASSSITIGSGSLYIASTWLSDGSYRPTLLPFRAQNADSSMTYLKCSRRSRSKAGNTISHSGLRQIEHWLHGLRT
eukprot:2802742-Alexandrium_andersonii.AAC.1